MSSEPNSELTKDKLLQHYGHNIVIAKYGPIDSAVNIALECENCNEVLTDYDLTGYTRKEEANV